jgi:hypothetical protein
MGSPFFHMLQTRAKTIYRVTEFDAGKRCAWIVFCKISSSEIGKTKGSVIF